MNPTALRDHEIEELLSGAARGDQDAARSLLGMHRRRLRRLIATRLDRRLAPRLDPSDVVQETLADAARRLPDYVRDRPLPFYPWLFRLAVDRVTRTHRYHVESAARGIGRETRIDRASHREGTSAGWGDRLVDDESAPGRRLVREERRQLLMSAIEHMDDDDRGILGLRYFDRLAFDEIAAVLDIGLSAAKMRHLRALERLRALLEGMGVEPSNAP